MKAPSQFSRLGTPILSDGEAREVGHGDREQHDDDVARLTEAIEDHAQDKERQIPYLEGNRVVDEQVILIN